MQQNAQNTYYTNEPLLGFTDSGDYVYWSMYGQLICGLSPNVFYIFCSCNIFLKSAEINYIKSVLDSCIIVSLGHINSGLPGSL